MRDIQISQIKNKKINLIDITMQTNQMSTGGMQREKQNKILLVPLVSTDGTHLQIQ